NRNWANAHNFYGDFQDLDAATLGDVQAFFRTYYTPSNAVLLLVGDVEPANGFALAEKHFGSIPAGAPPPPADVSEPPQTEERRGTVPEPLGTLPAMAIGYHVPPRRTPEWYALALADRALHGGRAGRIYRALVRARPLPASELEQVKVKLRSDFYSTLEGGAGSSVPRFGLMHYLACFTLFDGDPSLLNTALDGFLRVTPEELHAAAGRVLRPENRSIVLRLPVAKTAPRGTSQGDAHGH